MVKIPFLTNDIIYYLSAIKKAYARNGITHDLAVMGFFPCHFRSPHESREKLSKKGVSRKNTRGNPLRRTRKVSNEYITLNEVYRCDVCNRCFTTIKILNKHKLRHIDGSHKCDLCGQTFRHKYRLRDHMYSHNNVKPFPCPICEKHFRRKHERTKHVRTVHDGIKYTTYKTYKCTLCPKTFTHLAALEDHQYVHTGQKSHICERCSASFTNKAGLLVHIKVLHEGTRKPQEACQCELCGKSFKGRQSYRVHMKNTHGDAKPTCHVCGKKVSSKEFLVVHMNMHTGQNLSFANIVEGRSLQKNI
uniref:Zinc finger protein 26 n=1 Tax=Cacopsylla melanoneura TaxID=428564 RepID=A0A8D8Q5R0_9HEMI